MTLLTHQHLAMMAGPGFLSVSITIDSRLLRASQSCLILQGRGFSSALGLC